MVNILYVKNLKQSKEILHSTIFGMNGKKMEAADFVVQERKFLIDPTYLNPMHMNLFTMIMHMIFLILILM